MSTNAVLTVLLADPMVGVREAWRDVLASDERLVVVAEAETVAQVLVSPGQVVLTGLHFSDGTAMDVIAGEQRPVVVWAVLPADEHGLVLHGAAAVVQAGELREGLIPALIAAGA